MPDVFRNPLVIGGLLALSGLVIGMFSSWVLALINRHYDDRRHLRQIAIETAIVYWKQDIEIGKLRMERLQTDVRVKPLDTYIVHMLQLAELVSRKRLTAENIEAELSRIRDFTHAAGKAADKKYDN